MKSRRNKLLQQRLRKQQKQIRTILIDYQKSIQKCLKYYEELGDVWEYYQHFQAVQNQVELKVNLVDLFSLIGLKNQLVQELIKLYQIESQLDTKTKMQELVQKPNTDNKNDNECEHKIKMKKIKSLYIGQIHDLMDEDDLINNQEVDFVFMAHEDKNNDDKQNENININEENNVEMNHKPGLSMFDIPVYRPKDDNAENKIDRIARYVAALKRNMKRNTEQHIKNQKNRKQLLQLDPQFISLQQQLQQYHKQEIDIQQYIHKNIYNTIQQLQKENAETIQQNYEYKIIKIDLKDTKATDKYVEYMKCIKDVGEFSQSQYQQQQCDYYEEEESSGFKNSVQKLNQQDQSRQFSKDNLPISVIVDTIDQTIDNSNKKLNDLRERRKKLFNDHLWADDE